MSVAYALSALLAAGLLLVLLLACVKPLGLYMANIFDGRPIWPRRTLGGCERGICRLCGIDPRYLVTETGLGYRLRMDEQTPAEAAG